MKHSEQKFSWHSLKICFVLLLQSEFSIRLFWITFSFVVSLFFYNYRKCSFYFFSRYSKPRQALADSRASSFKFYDVILVYIKLFVTLILTSNKPWNALPSFLQRIQHLQQQNSKDEKNMHLSKFIFLKLPIKCYNPIIWWLYICTECDLFISTMNLVAR